MLHAGPEGLHVTGKDRHRSMQHTCSRHAVWAPHTGPLHAGGGPSSPTHFLGAGLRRALAFSRSLSLTHTNTQTHIHTDSSTHTLHISLALLQATWTQARALRPPAAGWRATRAEAAVSYEGGTPVSPISYERGTPVSPVVSYQRGTLVSPAVSYERGTPVTERRIRTRRGPGPRRELRPPRQPAGGLRGRRAVLAARRKHVAGCHVPGTPISYSTSSTPNPILENP